MFLEMDHRLTIEHSCASPIGLQHSVFLHVVLLPQSSTYKVPPKQKRINKQTSISK